MSVAVNLNRGAWKSLATPQALARKAANAAFRITDTERASASVSISLSDDRTLAQLNRRWRAVRKATNVLAFPGGRTAMHSRARPFLGDVILAGGVVAREARQQGKTLKGHTAHLIIHGVLHLLGYNHANAKDAAVMEKLEIEALRTLGIPDPYQHE